MKTFKTSEVAKIIGVHPNTVRLYETCKLIPTPMRDKNAYRIFTSFHIEQFQLARKVLEVEVLQNGLRKKAVEIVKLSASGAFDKAIALTESYLDQIKSEQMHAEAAINSAKHIFVSQTHTNDLSYTRKETANMLHITMDTLRNWELNGLLKIKRKQNGYRMYSAYDIEYLKIIRALRGANYSLAAILRMLTALNKDPNTDISVSIDTPHEEDEIVSVCDRLMTSLKRAEENAESVLAVLKQFKNKYSNPTL